MKVFKDLEINVDPKAVMSTMSVSQRQMVEIAKAVSYNSKIIVFDEPTSSLTEEEVEHLFRLSICSGTEAAALFIFLTKWRKFCA